MARMQPTPNPDIKYVADARVIASAVDLREWKVDKSSGTLVADGPCPTCRHTTSTLVVTDIVADIASGGSSVPPEKRMTRRFACGCVPHHQDRPIEVKGGCGRWWMAAVVRGDGDTFEMIPAEDQSLVFAATTLDEAARNEISAVRASCEKWLPAVTALYGLFGLASLVVGKDSLDKIPVDGRIAVAVLITAGLIATMASIFYGYRAAFGWFTVHDVSDDVKLAMWFRERRAAIVRAPENLRNALTSAAIALALLLGSVGVLWFWPASDPASPIVEVTYRVSGVVGQVASVCGPLKPGTGQNFIVQTTNGSRKDPVTIDLAWVDDIKPKENC